MFDFWKDELDEEQSAALIEKAAAQIRKRKLEVPAILALESHKPLGFVAAHAAVMFSPFMVPFLGFEAVNGYSQLISKRENIDRLIAKLEEDPKSIVEVECNT